MVMLGVDDRLEPGMSQTLLRCGSDRRVVVEHGHKELGEIMSVFSAPTIFVHQNIVQRPTQKQHIFLRGKK